MNPDAASSEPQWEDEPPLPDPVADRPMPVKAVSSVRDGLALLQAVSKPEELASSSLSSMLVGETRVTQARMVLVDVLKKHAPVAGAMLAMRVSRASHREDLVTLLDEATDKLDRADRPADVGEALAKAKALLTG
jgi:hypothetical protein